MMWNSLNQRIQSRSTSVGHQVICTPAVLPLPRGLQQLLLLGLQQPLEPPLLPEQPQVPQALPRARDEIGAVQGQGLLRGHRTGPAWPTWVWQLQGRPRTSTTNPKAWKII